MDDRPNQQGEGPGGESVGGIQTIFTTGELVYPSIIAFLAWVVCVYDYMMFGTLLPKMADDFGWSTCDQHLDRDRCVDRDLLRSHLGGTDDRLSGSEKVSDDHHRRHGHKLRPHGLAPAGLRRPT